MAERHVLLKCPVCLGTSMQRRSLGVAPVLHVDCCRRCGGVWLDTGEVQRLRRLEPSELWQHLVPRPRPMRVPCHDCHTPMERSDAVCTQCGWTNLLDCPVCDALMRVESHAGIRLDVCRTCKGVWFDHHELKEIWSTQFDRVLHRRSLATTGAKGGDTVERVMEDVLFHAVFLAPDALAQGTAASVHSIASATDVAGAMAALPEASGAVLEAAGEAASGVFDTVVEIIAGVFGS